MIENEKTAEQAAQWVAREDRGLAPDERIILSAWLDESTGNRVAYLRLSAIWGHTARLAALRNSYDVGDRRTRNLRYGWSFAAIAALVLVAVGVGLYFKRGTPVRERVYAAVTGERPMLRLSDGTKVQLSPNTRIRAGTAKAIRMMTLEKGEAYFEVAHNAKRPFVVLAGNYKITDLGTKFSVRRDGSDIRVVVTEGHVRIDDLNTPTLPAPIYAEAGDVVVAKDDETLVTLESAQKISDELSWRDGTLVFNQETLADAADEFNRYSRKRIVVTGTARDIRIGGRFRADNVDVFAVLVQKSLGLNVKSGTDEILISQ